MLTNIKIVLIQTFHPGNIGAAARAMKNMGLSQLVLVNPVNFPHEEATSRAGQATDILENACVVSSLQEAIADCSLVIAASARNRSMALPILNTREAGKQLVLESYTTNVALVFGRERMGLLNDDIQQCHLQVNIEANPDYPVLNIAQAIQILCYEIYQASIADALTGALADTLTNDSVEEYPLNKELESFYKHFEQTLKNSDFFDDNRPGMAMDNFRAMFRRARPTAKELKLLRGALSSLDNSRGSY